MQPQLTPTWDNQLAFEAMSQTELEAQIAYQNMLAYVTKQSGMTPVLTVVLTGYVVGAYYDAELTFTNSQGKSALCGAVYCIMMPQATITCLMEAGLLPFAPVPPFVAPPAAPTPPVVIDTNFNDAIGDFEQGYPGRRMLSDVSWTGRVPLGAVATGPDGLSYRFSESLSIFNRTGDWAPA